MLSSDGPEYELLRPLHSDMFFQDKLLMNGVDVKIKLMCSKYSFCLMSSLAAGSCKLVITYALLFVKKVRVVPGACLVHTQALLNGQH